MPLLEKVNPAVCDKLANISLDQFALLYKLFKNNENKDQQDDQDIQTAFSITTKTCKEFQKNNYQLTNIYTQNDGIGRQYVKTLSFSLQKMSGIFRDALAEGLYFDYDIKNAHPVLLEYLCRLHNVDCDILSYFNHNREKCYQGIMEDSGEDRNYAKKLFITSINSEWAIVKHPTKYKPKVKDQIFQKFDAEMKTIQKLLIKSYDGFSKRVRYKKTNKKGTFIANLLQDQENVILNLVLNSPNTPEASVKMYDGFLVLQDRVPDKNELITTLNELTDKFKIKWDIKPILSPITQNILDLDVIEHEFKPFISNIAYDHAIILLERQLKERFYNSQNTFYLKTQTKWVSDEKFINHSLIKMLCSYEHYFIREVMGEFKIEHIRTNLTLIDNIIRQLKAHATHDDKLLDKIFEATKTKLYFNNCIYNFQNNKTEPNDYNSFISIDRDLILKSNPDVREEIYRRILNPIFTSHDKEMECFAERCMLRDYFLHFCARALGGCIEDKHWGSLLGFRNCGKGVLNDLFIASFGAYTKATNGENFIFKKNQDESSKANSWILGLQFQRMIFCNEMAIDNRGGTTMCGNKIKKFHSGGDYIEARGNYQNEKNIRVAGRCFFSMNDMPDVKPSDALEKLVCFEFKSKFLKEGESKKYSNISYFDADDTIKSEFIKREDVQNEFVLMIIQAYQNDIKFPKRIKKEMAEDAENDDDVFVNLFEFTGINGDRLSNKFIRTLLDQNNINFTIRKAGTILVGKGAKRYKNGANRGLSGIKIAELEEEE